MLRPLIATPCLDEKLCRESIATPSRNTDSRTTLADNLEHFDGEISEMKRVMALVLGVALVGASAATTFAQTGTGTGGGTGTKSTTTTTSPTRSPTTGATTSRTTTKQSTTEDCPGHAEKSKGKATAHNPNCREVPKR